MKVQSWVIPCSSRAAHVVTEEKILVTQVEPSTGDDGVGPCRLAAALRLVKAALLDVSGGRRLDQRHGTALAASVEAAVRGCDGTFAHAPVRPGDLARLEVQAGQVGTVEAVEVVAHQHHAAV